jgi:hypothetical protein
MLLGHRSAEQRERCASASGHCLGAAFDGDSQFAGFARCHRRRELLQCKHRLAARSGVHHILPLSAGHGVVVVRGFLLNLRLRGFGAIGKVISAGAALRGVEMVQVRVQDHLVQERRPAHWIDHKLIERIAPRLGEACVDCIGFSTQ